MFRVQSSKFCNTFTQIYHELWAYSLPITISCLPFFLPLIFFFQNNHHFKILIKLDVLGKAQGIPI